MLHPKVLHPPRSSCLPCVHAAVCIPACVYTAPTARLLPQDLWPGNRQTAVRCWQPGCALFLGLGSATLSLRMHCLCSSRHSAFRTGQFSAGCMHAMYVQKRRRPNSAGGRAAQGSRGGEASGGPDGVDRAQEQETEGCEEESTDTASAGTRGRSRAQGRGWSRGGGGSRRGAARGSGNKRKV